MLTTLGLPLLSGLATFLAFDLLYSHCRNAADARRLNRRMADVEQRYAPLHRHFATLPQVHGCVSLGLIALNGTPMSVVLDTLACAPEPLDAPEPELSRRYRVYLASNEGVMRPQWVRLTPQGRGTLTFGIGGHIRDLIIDAFGVTRARLSLNSRPGTQPPPALERHNRFIQHASELLRGADLSHPKAVSLARRRIARDIHPDQVADGAERRDRTAALAWANDQLDKLVTRPTA